MTSFDPYVAEPAEPPRPRKLSGLAPGVAIAAVLILVIAVAVLTFTRGATEDPAVGDPGDRAGGRPGDRATEQRSP